MAAYVRLYTRGESQIHCGSVGKIRKPEGQDDWDLFDLKNAVKEEWPSEFEHCTTLDFDFYAPSTAEPQHKPRSQCLPPQTLGANLAGIMSAENPLSLVFPPVPKTHAIFSGAGQESKIPCDTSDNIWEPVEAEFIGGFENIRRQPENVPSRYRYVLEEIGCITEKRNEDQSNQTSKRSALSNKTANSVGVEKLDLFGYGGGQDAHQFPDSKTCINPYGIIAQPILGIDIENLSAEKLTEMISNKNKNDKSRPEENTGIDVENEMAEDSKAKKAASKGKNKNENSKEAQATTERKNMNDKSEEKRNLVKELLAHIASDSQYSVKNLALNKLRVIGNHEYCYDVEPFYATLPLMKLEAAKGWKAGEGYWIGIICKDEKAYQELLGYRLLKPRDQRSKLDFANEDELLAATELLASVVKAHAEIANGTRGGVAAVVSPLDFLTGDLGEKMKTLRENLGEGLVRVPGKPRAGARVLKVYLESSHDYEIPDPMLVAVKAAINWYYMAFGIKLLPVCKKPTDPEKARIEELNRELEEEDEQEELRLRVSRDLASAVGSMTIDITRPAHVSLSPQSSFADSVENPLVDDSSTDESFVDYEY